MLSRHTKGNMLPKFVYFHSNSSMTSFPCPIHPWNKADAWTDMWIIFRAHHGNGLLYTVQFAFATTISVSSIGNEVSKNLKKNCVTWHDFSYLNVKVYSPKGYILKNILKNKLSRNFLEFICNSLWFSQL